MKVPIDERVRNYIEQMIDDGVCNISEMRRDVCRFVKELFGTSTLPKATNRRFYPSNQDLSSLMYRCRRAKLQGLLDQEMVQVKVTEFNNQRPNDSWYFRPSLSSEDNAVPGQKLLVVYQADWQRQLLLRYGQELVFLDATYRTTRYAVPLFFLCVHTNDGYIVVGIIILEREDSESLAEALEIVKTENPDWKPKWFMVDASEMEIAAINSTFAGPFLYSYLPCKMSQLFFVPSVIGQVWDTKVANLPLYFSYCLFSVIYL